MTSAVVRPSNASSSSCDTAALRAYLRQRADGTLAEEDEDGAFEAFIALFEDFAALRWEAENRHNRDAFRARNKSGALPVSWSAVADVFSKNRNEPPVTIITRIAQEHLPLVASILANLRKILRRTRMQVPVARVRQLDSECLRRFSMLPGGSSEEKAASRRTILGVERVESFDTLENRVLKAFLARCEREARRYLRHYQNAYTKASERILAVKRLESVFHEELLAPVWDGVRALREFPQPNFVLRQDPRYSKLWALFKELVDQDRTMERTWPARNNLFSDIARLWLRMTLFAEEESLHADNAAIPRFGGEPWILREPVEGHVLDAVPMVQFGYRGEAAGSESLSLRETANDGIRIVTTCQKASGWLDIQSVVISFSIGRRNVPSGISSFALLRDESLESGIVQNGNVLRIGNGTDIMSAMAGAANRIAKQLLKTGGRA